MMPAKMLMAVAAGGALGAMGRYIVASRVMRLVDGSFPYGTLTVNVLGSFLMGVLVGLLALRLSASPQTQAFLMVGLLGGFTTFSSFSLEVVLLFERHMPGLALFYVLLSAFLSIGALFGGLYAIRALF